MNDCQKDFSTGFIIATVIWILIWIGISMAVEDIKVEKGYLTCRGKTYKVVLYDTLDTPEKETK